MWTEIKSEFDVFFKPKTKRDQVDAEPPQWRTVDMKLNKQRLDTLKQRLKKPMSKDELALRRRAALIGKRFISHHHIFWVNRLA